MATLHYITQPAGVGIRRQLNDIETDHIICLLRVVERLHLLSTPAGKDQSVESLKRQLASIHKNHLELEACVRLVLSGDGQH